MFNPLRAYFDYRLKRLELKLAAKNAPFTAMTGMMHEWMGMWKSTDLPTSTVVRDLDEWKEEQERLGYEGTGLNSAVAESLANGAKAGITFPELTDLLKQRPSSI